MKTFSELLFGTFVSVTWIAGVVLAKGFWSTLLAICLPFWAWYLVIEKLMHRFL